MIELIASHSDDDRPQITITIDSDTKNEHGKYGTKPSGYKAVISDELDGSISVDGRLMTDGAASALDVVALFEKTLGYNVDYTKGALLVEHTGDYVD